MKNIYTVHTSPQYTPEAHATADLYHEGQLATAEALVVWRINTM